MFKNRALQIQVKKAGNDDVETRTVDLTELDAFIARNGKRLVAGIGILYAVVKTLDTVSQIAILKTDRSVVVVQAPQENS